MNAKLYLSTQPNPSSLFAALSRVDLNCRANTACVTVVISHELEPGVLAIVRRMEDDLLMTVIIAGVEYEANSSSLSLLASSSSNLYAIAVEDFYHLPYLSFQLPTIIDDISRPQVLNSPLNLPTLVIGQDYTVLVDINKSTIAQDVLVSFTFSFFRLSFLCFIDKT